ncbi:hypothetical protein BKI52_34455 [marine bacterium AO1-C]|nr:hypothetical protein BKI52_34455 [marine bacterium AO1-C]
MLMNEAYLGEQGLMKNQRKVLIVSRDEGFQGSISVVKQIANSLDLVIINKVSRYEQALRSIQQTMPDLIICEASLEQETDGIELMRLINKIHPIPVFFILNEHQSNLVEQTKEFTTTGVILKPLSTTQLKLSLKLSFTKVGLFI